MHQVFTDLSKARARLHLSESPFPLEDSFLEAIAEEARLAHIYPEPGSPTATNRLAEHWAIATDSLVLANGCDDIILNTFLKFGHSGKALITANTYPGYREIAALANQEIVEVPLKNWKVDIDAFIERMDGDTRLAVICNPHNPTASLLDQGEIDRFIGACNDRDIIPVIDEAYLDFAQNVTTLVPSINRYKNLIVWRSFAKSHGLAGIRLGAAVGTPSLLAKLKEGADSNPFSVNRIAQRMVLEIANNERPFEENRKKVILIRDQMQRELKGLGIWYSPSSTNFLFMKAPDGIDAASFFRETGVFVRDCVSYGLPNYWRVACGNEQEMTFFVDGLKQMTHRMG